MGNSGARAGDHVLLDLFRQSQVVDDHLSARLHRTPDEVGRLVRGWTGKALRDPGVRTTYGNAARPVGPSAGCTPPGGIALVTEGPVIGPGRCRLECNPNRAGPDASDTGCRTSVLRTSVAVRGDYQRTLATHGIEGRGTDIRLCRGIGGDHRSCGLWNASGRGAGRHGPRGQDRSNPAS